eukprot:scaffold7863_cov277-Pinguiococcus_pyrenoidosus.AAC.4
MDGQGVEVAGLHTCAYSHAHTYGMPTPFNRNVRHPDLERAILGQKIRRPVESGRCCGRGDRQEENSYTKTTAPPDSPGMRSLRYRRPDPVPNTLVENHQGGLHHGVRGRDLRRHADTTSKEDAHHEGVEDREEPPGDRLDHAPHGGLAIGVTSDLGLVPEPLSDEHRDALGGEVRAHHGEGDSPVAIREDERAHGGDDAGRNAPTHGLHGAPSRTVVDGHGGLLLWRVDGVLMSVEPFILVVPSLEPDALAQEACRLGTYHDVRRGRRDLLLLGALPGLELLPELSLV